MSTVSVVTGAGGAMGTACALALALASDSMVLTDVDRPRLGDLASHVERESTTKVEVLPGDIGEVGFVQELAARVEVLGEMRALVHTAGLSPTMATWREILRIHLAAVPVLLDTFLPIVAPGGVAVCIGSIAGHVGSFDPAMDTVCDDPLASDFEQRFTALEGETPDSGASYRLAKTSGDPHMRASSCGVGETRRASGLALTWAHRYAHGTAGARAQRGKEMDG